MAKFADIYDWLNRPTNMVDAAGTTKCGDQRVYRRNANGNASMTYLLNSSQSMVASYRYDPFGNTITKSGALADANVYRFSSKEIHPNSGMYYYGFRFYDPNLQRWINRDPLEEEGGLNLYEVVYDDPLFYIDRNGLDVAGPLPELPPTSPSLRPPFPGLPPLEPLRPPMPLRPPIPRPGPPPVMACAAAFAVGYAAGTLIDQCTPVGKIGPAIGNKIWPLKSVSTITCWLSPLSDKPNSNCIYHCSTGPGQGFQIVRRPGPLGCPDTINIVIPDDSDD